MNMLPVLAEYGNVIGGVLSVSPPVAGESGPLAMSKAREQETENSFVWRLCVPLCFAGLHWVPHS